MTEEAKFLMDKYYSRYNRIPTPPLETLEMAIKAHKDRLIIIRDENIKGIGIYLTLTDETFKVLRELELADEATANRLWDENGKNVHFIILAADSLRTILKGMEEVIEKEDPKTVSWFNPEHTNLHTRRYK